MSNFYLIIDERMPIQMLTVNMIFIYEWVMIIKCQKIATFFLNKRN